MKLELLTSPQFNKAYDKLANSTNLPTSAKFLLKKQTRIIAEHVKDFNDVRESLVQEYSRKDAEGNPERTTMNDGSEGIVIENIPEFNKHLIDLLRRDVELPSIKAKDLGDALDTLSSVDLSILEFIEE